MGGVAIPAASFETADGYRCYGMAVFRKRDIRLGHQAAGTRSNYNRSACSGLAEICGMAERSQKLTSASGSFAAANIGE